MSILLPQAFVISWLDCRLALIALCSYEISREKVTESAKGHDWSEWESVGADKDCDNDTLQRTCKVCKLTEIELNSNTGHEWSEPEITLNPSCTQEGIQEIRCTKCEVVRQESIPKSDHRFEKYVPDNNATCTADGTQTATCEECKEAKDTQVISNSALGHEFKDYVSNGNATCTENGTETAICNRKGCDATDTREQKESKLPHSFTNYVSDNNATCTDDGTETATCDLCNSEKKTRTVSDSALGHVWVVANDDNDHWQECARCFVMEESSKESHEWSEWEVTTPPACEEEGEQRHICTKCGAETYESIVALEHNYSHGEPVFEWTWPESGDEPVCTAIFTFACANDETHTYEEKINATVSLVELIEPSTCSEEGVALYTATTEFDGETYQVEKYLNITRLAHEFGEYQPGLAPTCTEEGSEYAMCKICGEITLRSVPALGHHFANYEMTKSPTCTEKGSETGYCNFCDAVGTREVSALGHQWQGGICIRCGEKLALSDKDSLEQQKEQLEQQLQNEDLSDEERQQIQNQLQSVQNALNSIMYASNVSLRISQLPDLKDATTADIAAIQAVKEAFDSLTDAEKDMIPSELKAKLELLVQHLEELPPANKPGTWPGPSVTPGTGTQPSTPDTDSETNQGETPETAPSTQPDITPNTKPGTTTGQNSGNAGSGNGKLDTSRTGDQTMLLFWMLFMIVSGSGAATILVYKRKRKNG